MATELPTVYLDLDGTLLDIRERYYTLYSHIIADLCGRALSQGTFWYLKRRGMPTDLLLADLDIPAREEYNRRWLAAIETHAYTRLDRLMPGAAAALGKLAGECRLVLATLRRERDALLQQLRSLSIEGFFDDIITPTHEPTGNAGKGELISESAPAEGGDALVVGDSEADIAAARHLGVPVVCVVTGIRDRAFLKALGPDFIIHSIAQLPDLVRTRRKLQALRQQI